MQEAPVPSARAVPVHPPVRVLWTGGWDSTFRVCMLAIVERVPVQPYYLFVPTRKGAGVEFTTIQRLKRRIQALDTGARAGIRPTIVLERDELGDTRRRKEQLDALRSQRFLGEQYEILAGMCDTLGLDDIELCIHRDDQAFRHLSRHVVPAEELGGKRYRLDPATPADLPIRLFESFRFPLLDLDKLAMREIATRHGFLDVMDHTWFCHSPRNGKPCGVCNPCEYAIEEGLGWRVPRASKLRSAMIKAARRARMLVFDPARAMRKAAERLSRSTSH